MEFFGTLASVKDFILDLIFPKFCVSCHSEGTFLCEKCLSKIVFVQSPICPTCQKLTPKGQFCPRCRQKSNLTGIAAACYWREGPLRQLVHVYKYEGVKELADTLSAFLIYRLKKSPLSKKTLVVPIPLHPKRLGQRGFNQSLLLAQRLGLYFNLPVCPEILQRKKYTSPQVELSGWARQANVKNIFLCQKNAKIKNKTILLVDDVATTGATLEQAAKVLRRSGARQVWGAVLAIG